MENADAQTLIDIYFYSEQSVTFRMIPDDFFKRLIDYPGIEVVGKKEKLKFSTFKTYAA